ncbi:23S rRNA pseudouridine(2604) synthase RluF [Clostridium sp. 'White wine YQ']|uniref:23S rRNA pseudouridine(2604) synthase RluF n=1 Tax=Clostridium sp. 'White wine YQ' TaxID=3027474 RepID=UPI002366064B|nr:23S rRNA pseudouridine(2604) synthase RluF [Clostridium sp. 'White wine YQ']MDD7795424.1 23S rRNA pseudouridine(2604) synthase RluF [Clostridium sp. 'White wine YQ']
MKNRKMTADKIKAKKQQNSSQNSSNIIKHLDSKSEIRLNKYISDSGFCSRREADKLITLGKVYVDGVKAVMGTKVSSGQEVKIDNKIISKGRKLIYLALNKPVGITCTTEHKIKGNIVDFIGHKERIFPIGRLDKDSQGLILLTNDGDIVNKILRAGNNHEKEYLVTVDRNITQSFIEKMSSGVKILGTVTKKCFVKKESNYVFRIILTQGLNRQIRRMCEALGYEVKKLERTRIMNVHLGSLNIGEWRYLEDDELNEINELISYSKKAIE